MDVIVSHWASAGPSSHPLHPLYPPLYPPFPPSWTLSIDWSSAATWQMRMPISGISFRNLCGRFRRLPLGDRVRFRCGLGYATLNAAAGSCLVTQSGALHHLPLVAPRVGGGVGGGRERGGVGRFCLQLPGVSFQSIDNSIKLILRYRN